MTQRRRIARVIVTVAALSSASPAFSQMGRGENVPPGARVIENGDSRAVILPAEKARQRMLEELPPEMLAAREARQKLRALRQERREAMERARQSGDPQAMADVLTAYRERMEASREKVREARDALRERYENDPRYRGMRGEGRSDRGRTRGGFERGRRFRTWRRLRALAPPGALERPSDVPEPVRAELRTHGRRVATLDRIVELAEQAGDSASVTKAESLVEREHARHRRALRVLLRGRRSAQESREVRGDRGANAMRTGMASSTREASPGSGRRTSSAASEAEEDR